MKKSTSLICIFGAVSLATFVSACSGTEDDDGDVLPGAGGTPAVGEGGTLFDGAGTWVALESNTVGIQGSFFVLEDSMANGAPVPADMLSHTDLMPDEFDDTTASPCVSGTVAPVTATDGTACGFNAGDAECDFATWGGGIGMNLNETGGADSDQSPWNATAAGVTGFTFDINFGGFTGKDVRFKATMDGSDQDFCVKIAEGTNTVMLSELTHECWGTTGTMTLDVTQLVQLQWQLVTEPGNTFEVQNFCVNSLSWF